MKGEWCFWKYLGDKKRHRRQKQLSVHIFFLNCLLFGDDAGFWHKQVASSRLVNFGASFKFTGLDKSLLSTSLSLFWKQSIDLNKLQVPLLFQDSILRSHWLPLKKETSLGFFFVADRLKHLESHSRCCHRLMHLACHSSSHYLTPIESVKGCWRRKLVEVKGIRGARERKKGW